MKKSVVLGLLVIILAFCVIGCGNDGNGDDTDDIYTVTIGTLTNGTITASPTSGTVGTEISLTVTPDNGYQLKAGTLKYGTTAIDEATKKFNLPAENVTVTAEFESNAAFIVGIWIGTFYDEEEDEEFSIYLQLNADNTFAAYGASNPVPTGTYALSGNTITLTFTVNGPPGNEVQTATLVDGKLSYMGILFAKTTATPFEGTWNLIEGGSGVQLIFTGNTYIVKDGSTNLKECSFTYTTTTLTETITNTFGNDGMNVGDQMTVNYSFTDPNTLVITATDPFPVNQTFKRAVAGSENDFVGTWEFHQTAMRYMGLIFKSDFTGTVYQTTYDGSSDSVENIDLVVRDFTYEIVNSSMLVIAVNASDINCTYLFSSDKSQVTIDGLMGDDYEMAFIKQTTPKTIVGKWMKIYDNETLIITALSDNTWTYGVVDEPDLANGTWNINTLSFVYDYPGNPDAPEDMSVDYTLTINGNLLTLSGENVNLFGGSDPWVRVE